MIKEHELEAKERLKLSPGRPKKPPQKSAERYDDENLRRYDLTAWEQSQHIDRREELLKKKGERRKDGGNGSNQHKSNPVTVTGLQKSTAELATEAGMSERTYQRRAKVGHSIASATADILNSITDLEACDLPDSPKQLEYLAKLEKQNTAPCRGGVMRR